MKLYELLIQSMGMQFFFRQKEHHAVSSQCHESLCSRWVVMLNKCCARLYSLWQRVHLPLCLHVTSLSSYLQDESTTMSFKIFCKLWLSELVSIRESLWEQMCWGHNMFLIVCVDFVYSSWRVLIINLLYELACLCNQNTFHTLMEYYSITFRWKWGSQY